MLVELIQEPCDSGVVAGPLAEQCGERYVWVLVEDLNYLHSLS